MVVCEGRGIQRGGACRRINGRGLWQRGEETEEVESRPLWRAAISHLLTALEHTVVATGLSPQPCLPEGLTSSLR